MQDTGLAGRVCGERGPRVRLVRGAGGPDMEIRLRRAPGVVLPYVALSSYGRFDGRMRTSTRPILAPSAVRATVASVAGMLLVAIVSATPNSPFYPVLPDGVGAQGPLRWVADLLQLQRLDDAGLMLAGLVAVVGGRDRLHPHPARGVAPTDLGPDGRPAGGRVPPVGAHPAAAVLARRLQLRVLRTHLDDLRGEPVRAHAERLPEELAVDAHVAGLARDAVGLRAAVHVGVGDHDRRAAKRHEPGPRVPGAGGDLEPRARCSSCGAWSRRSVPIGPCSRSP